MVVDIVVVHPRLSEPECRMVGERGWPGERELGERELNEARDVESGNTSASRRGPQGVIKNRSLHQTRSLSQIDSLTGLLSSPVTQTCTSTILIHSTEHRPNRGSATVTASSSRRLPSPAQPTAPHSALPAINPIRTMSSDLAQARRRLQPNPLFRLLKVSALSSLVSLGMGLVLLLATSPEFFMISLFGPENRRIEPKLTQAGIGAGEGGALASWAESSVYVEVSDHFNQADHGLEQANSVSFATHLTANQRPPPLAPIIIRPPHHHRTSHWSLVPNLNLLSYRLVRVRPDPQRHRPRTLLGPCRRCRHPSRRLDRPRPARALPLLAEGQVRQRSRRSSSLVRGRRTGGGRGGRDRRGIVDAVEPR